MTNQLNGLEAISTFAALITPPGVRTHRSNLDELCVADSVLAAIAASRARSEIPTDDWLATSLDRLYATLQDLDPDTGLVDAPI